MLGKKKETPNPQLRPALPQNSPNKQQLQEAKPAAPAAPKMDIQEAVFLRSGDLKEIKLTPEESKTINAHLKQNQYLVHMVFRGPARINRVSADEVILILTAHYILIFQYTKIIPTKTVYVAVKGRKEKVARTEPDPARAYMKLVHRMSIHISSITLIAYSKDRELLLKTSTENVILCDEGKQKNLEFGQMVYRNYQIAFSVLDKSDIVEVRSYDMSLFPDIDIYISPSQRFQFLYYGLCSKYEAKYYHEVVRFVHSMVLDGSSIIDLSKIPIDLFGKYANGYDLRPIFHALSLMDFVCGVCCTNTNRPAILDELIYMFQKKSRIQIIYLVNCQAKTGMKRLEEIVNKKNKSPVVYWNLQGNRFDDFDSFTNVLRYSAEPVICLNVSDCGVTAENSATLFKMMSDCPNMHDIQHLHIAGMQFDDSSIANFSQWLRVISETGKSSLNTLDLSRITTKLDDCLRALIDFPQPITSLKITDVAINEVHSELLIQIIKNSKTLKSLDMSKTHIDPESIVRVISAIANNKDLRGFEIALDSLKLQTGNLLPIFRVFLESSLNKWKGISMNDNEMNTDDLRNMIPLFKMMKNLTSLSLNGNFDAKMDNITKILIDLLHISSLKKISIAGSAEHKLGTELIPFIDELKNHPNIVDIDISNHAMGDEGYAALKRCLKATKHIKALHIDGSMPGSIESIASLKSLIRESSITTFDFPVNDGIAITGSMVDSQGSVSVSRLADIQLSVNNSVSRNRSKQKMIPVLPFQVDREMSRLILTMTENSRSQFLENEKPLVHSKICEEYGLVLPHQKPTDIVGEGGKEIVIPDMEHLQIYKAKCLMHQIHENKHHYTAPDPKDVALESSSDEEYDDSDSEDEIALANQVGWASVSEKKKSSKKKSHKKSHKKKDDSSSESEEETPKKSKKSKKSKKKLFSSSESEEEKEQKKSSAKKYVMFSESSDDNEPPNKTIFDSDEPDDEKTKKKNKKKSDKKKTSSKKKNSHKKSSKKHKHTSESSEEETPKKKSSKKKIVTPESVKEEPSADSDSDDTPKKSKQISKFQEDLEEYSGDEESPRRKYRRRIRAIDPDTGSEVPSESPTNNKDTEDMDSADELLSKFQLPRKLGTLNTMSDEESPVKAHKKKSVSSTPDFEESPVKALVVFSDSEESPKQNKKKQPLPLSSDAEELPKKGKKKQFSDSEDESPKQSKKKQTPVTPDSEEELPKKSKKKQTPATPDSEEELPKKSKKKQFSDSEDELPKKSKKKQPLPLSSDAEELPKKGKKKQFSDSEDESPKQSKKKQIPATPDSEEELPKKNKKKQFSDSEDELPKKGKKKQIPATPDSEEELPKKGKKKQFSDSEDESPKQSKKKQIPVTPDSEEDSPKKSKKTLQNGKPIPRITFVDSDSSERDSPPKKQKSKGTVSKRNIFCLFSDDEDQPNTPSFSNTKDDSEFDDLIDASFASRNSDSQRPKPKARTRKPAPPVPKHHTRKPDREHNDTEFKRKAAKLSKQ